MKLYNSWQDYYNQNSEDYVIKNFGKLVSPVASSLSFINDEKYLKTALENKNIIGLIGPSYLYDKHKDSLELEIYIYSDTPLESFMEFYEFWMKRHAVKNPSNISNNTQIDTSANISPYNVVIEDDVIIENNVVIKDHVTIKKGTIIRSNCVIGSEGFEVIRINSNNKFVKHSGHVIIGEDSQLQEGCIVDIGIYGQTTSIGKYSMLDKHVHLGHNAVIGDNALITSGSIVGGNTTIGNNFYMGLGSIISNRLTIGDNVKVRIGSTVIKNIDNDTEVSGHFAIPHKQYMKLKILLNRMLKK